MRIATLGPVDPMAASLSAATGELIRHPLARDCFDFALCESGSGAIAEF